MIIHQYPINTDFSAARVEINGNHGEMKNTREDRIYFILKGEGKFVINDKENAVSQNDLVFIPKDTPYNIIGTMTYLLICSPAFNAEYDVNLK